MEYLPHPAAALFPLLGKAELAALSDDIRCFGLKVPIVLFEGQVLDGRNRLAACEAAGVVPRFETWTPSGGESPWDYVWSMNAERRHLDAGQKGMLHVRFQKASTEWKDEQSSLLAKSEAERKAKIAEATKSRERRPDGTLGKAKPDATSRDVVSGPKRKRYDKPADRAGAKAAGVSPSTVARARKLDDDHPDLADKVAEGRLSLGRAQKEATARERKQESEAAVASIMDSAGEAFEVFVADIRHGASRIETGSISAIVTDPPYPKEFLGLYSSLGQLAKRVLPPGGSLFALVGQSYLPQVYSMLSEHLTYHWTLSYLTPGGQSVQLWDRKVNTFWKPVLWFTNGSYSGEWKGDVLKSAVNDNDKRFHEWGQSESGMMALVNLAPIGGVVLDPFLGAGTTGVVAVATGRRFVGFDIENNHVETARARIAESIAKLRAR